MQGVADSYKGKSRGEWCQVLGITRSSLSSRIVKYGWPQAILMGASNPNLYSKSVGSVKRPYSKLDMTEIVEVPETTAENRQAKPLPMVLGISSMVGYREEFGGTRAVPSSSAGYSKVILRGIERGQIKCSETGREVSLLLCEICTVNNGCGVRA